MQVLPALRTMFIGIMVVCFPTAEAFELNAYSDDATSVKLEWTDQVGASEYEVFRDGGSVGATVAKVGRFTDFDLRPGRRYEYTVTAYDSLGSVVSRSESAWAKTKRWTDIRTHYTVLVLAFDPKQASLTTEETYLRHRIQFLELASLGSAVIEPYKGGIVSTPAVPAPLPGTNRVDYQDLVVRRDLQGLDGYSIVDLVELGEIDHVWVVRSPVDFGENTLIGNRPIQGNGLTSINTWRPIPVKCSRSFFVNAYSSDERSYDAYAHMVEGILTSISDGHPEFWPRDRLYTVYTNDRSSYDTTEAYLSLWEQFRVTDGWNGPNAVAYASAGNANIGSSHFPPTTPRTCPDYCYFDLGTWQRYVDSVADDWLAFPDFSGIKRKMNGYDFGAFNYYVVGDAPYADELSAEPSIHHSFQLGAASYHQWWFAHLPHNPGTTDRKLNNWWPYLYDFNRFTGALIDYRVRGFPETETRFRAHRREYGTEERDAATWGYWHSQNGFSPGGKAADLRIVHKISSPEYVRSGSRALKVSVENTQYWESTGFGRNDVFFPISRNAHWELSDVSEMRFSVKLGINAELIVDTNPIIRLYMNGGNRIELVPLVGGVYANRFADSSLMDEKGWYNFKIPLSGDPNWERTVIGYVDPALTDAEKVAARAELGNEILADVNYVEVSIRTVTSEFHAPYDVVSYYVDGLQLVEDGAQGRERGGEW